MARKRKNETVVEQEIGSALEQEPEPELKVVDKRRFARLLGLGPELEPEPEPEPEAPEAPDEPRIPSYVEELRERAARAEAHAKAEVEAVRARLERHFETRVAAARAEMVASILDVYDNLERALEVPGAVESPLYEGIAATRDIFLRKLGELGVEPVAAEGEPFDPERHDAIDEVPVDDPELSGKVVAEYQRGFRLGERLVRPAKVRVGRSEP